MGRRPREGDPAEELYLLLASVIRRLPRDVSLTQAATLSTLERTGPRRVTDLAVIHGVTQPSMTALVAGLEEAGYVRRERSPQDKRVSYVALTDAGRQYVTARRRAGADVLGRLIDKLSDEEQATLAAAAPVLRRLRELEDDARDGRPGGTPKGPAFEGSSGPPTQ